MPTTPGPTAPDMIPNKIVNAALKEAWQLSFLEGGFYQERGGWIYADSTNVTKLFVRLAAKNRSKPGKDSAAGMAIDLDNPEGNPGNPPPAGYKIVGNYHTHPLPAGNEDPSQADMINSYLRGVLGIVVSKSSIWYYGPEHRQSMNGEVGYPGKDGEYSGQKSKIYGPNPFPKVVKSINLEEGEAAELLEIPQE